MELELELEQRAWQIWQIRCSLLIIGYHARGISHASLPPLLFLSPHPPHRYIVRLLRPRVPCLPALNAPHDSTKFRQISSDTPSFSIFSIFLIKSGVDGIDPLLLEEDGFEGFEAKWCPMNWKRKCESNYKIVISFIGFFILSKEDSSKFYQKCNMLR